MEAVFSWVKNIVVFFLVLTLLEEALPASDYKKYIRAAAGIVFILIVFSPLLKLFGADGSMDYRFLWESFKNALAPDSAVQLEAFDGEAAAASRESWVLSKYQDNLKDQIRLLAQNKGYTVGSVDVAVESGKDSPDFGRIKEIRIVLRAYNDVDKDLQAGSQKESKTHQETTKPVEEIAPVDDIRPVSIGGNSPEDDPEKTDKTVNDDAVLELRRLLSENYGISMDQIVIITENEHKDAGGW